MDQPTNVIFVRVSNQKDQSTTTIITSQEIGDDEDDNKNGHFCSICCSYNYYLQYSSIPDGDKLLNTFCIIFNLQVPAPLSKDPFQCCLSCVEALKVLDLYYQKLKLVSSQFDVVRDHLMKMLLKSYLIRKQSSVKQVQQKQEWASIAEAGVFDRIFKGWKHNMEVELLKQKMSKNAILTEDLVLERSAGVNCQDFDQVGDQLHFSSDSEENPTEDHNFRFDDDEVKIETEESGELHFEDVEVKYNPILTEPLGDTGSHWSESVNVDLNETTIPPVNRQPRKRKRKAKSADDKGKKSRRKCKKYKSRADTKNKMKDENENLECAYCKRIFQTITQRRNHESKHKLVGGNTNIYNCQFCQLMIKTLGCFIMHLEKSHIPDGRVTYDDSFYFYLCDFHDCKECFISQESLEDHIGKSHSVIKCGQCGKVFADQDHHDTHIKNIHCDETRARKPGVACEFCHLDFEMEEALELHKTTHLVAVKPKTYVCEICGQKFRNYTYLSTHHSIDHRRTNEEGEDGSEVPTGKLTYLGKRKKTKPCEICGKLISAANYKQHKYRHLQRIRDGMESWEGQKRCNSTCMFGCAYSTYEVKEMGKHYITNHREQYMKEDGSVYCPKCFKVFPNEQLLKTHDNDVHAGKFCCDVCGKRFRHDVTLKTHKEHHRSTSNQVFSCKFCGKIFTTPLLFKRHVDLHRNKEKGTVKQRLHCEHCGKDVCIGRSHRLHLYNEHRDQYLKNSPFHCSICYVTFITRDDLHLHLLQHPKCKYCDKRFNVTHKLDEHERTHTKVQPHQCSTCGKKFSNSSNYRVHRKIHTGERPLHCPICPDNVGFFRKRNLEQHMAKCHEEGDS